MIRLFSLKQALCLRGTIPELAVTRAEQFMGDGYVPAAHGHIVIIQRGDKLRQFTEISDIGLVLTDDDGLPNYEFAEAHSDPTGTVFEVVFQVDDERTIAVFIPDAPWLNANLRQMLHKICPAE